MNGRGTLSLRLMLLSSCVALCCSCGAEENRSPAPAVGKRQQATTSTAQPQKPTCWEQAPLPGSKPGALPKPLCATYVAKPAPPGLLAKKLLYRDALNAKLAGDWKALSKDEKRAKARLLKKSIFSSTGGN